MDIDKFKNYLNCKKVKARSIENYAVDARKFYEWRERWYDEKKGKNINKDLVLKYIQFLRDTNIPHSTINRKLSTLRHIEKYLIEEGEIDQPFMLSIGNLKKSENKLKSVGEFEKFLAKQKISLKTVKNYSCDIRDFVRWAEGKKMNELSSAFPLYINSIEADKSLSTLKRKESAIRRYLKWKFGEMRQETPDSVAENLTSLTFGVPKELSGGMINQAMVIVSILILIVTQIMSLNNQEITRVNAADIENESFNLNKERAYTWPVKQLSIILDDKTAPEIENYVGNKENGSVLKIVLESNGQPVLQEEIENILSEENILTHASGQDRILAGGRETTIYHNGVSEESLVHITPTSSTNNAVLYVAEKSEGYFIVRIDTENVSDISFDWWSTK